MEQQLATLSQGHFSEADRERAGRKAKEAAERIVETSLSNLSRMRHALLGIVFVVGVIAVLFRFAPAPLVPEALQLLYWPASVFFLALGFLWWNIWYRSKRVETSIWGLIEHLSDVTLYLETIAGLMSADSNNKRESFPTEFTRLDLEKAWKAWTSNTDGRKKTKPPYSPPIIVSPRTVRDLATIAGSTSFISLLISKGLENGLLTEDRSIESNRITIKYKVAVGGSLEDTRKPDSDQSNPNSVLPDQTLRILAESVAHNLKCALALLEESEPIHPRTSPAFSLSIWNDYSDEFKRCDDPQSRVWIPLFFEQLEKTISICLEGGGSIKDLNRQCRSQAESLVRVGINTMKAIPSQHRAELVDRLELDIPDLSATP